MDYTFDYNILDPELRVESAVKLDYKTLLNLCKTSKGVFNRICGSNYFWEEKTKYDFGDLYDIKEFGRNWWDTYQHYRSVFTLDLIKTIKKREPLLAEGLLIINRERQFLMVDGYDEKEITALIAASYYGYRDIVRILLEEEGANPNLADINGDTALILASKKGHTDIVEMLLEAEADPNLMGEYGYTVLMLASEIGYTDIVKMLLDKEANPNLADEDGWTALMVASYEDHIDIVKMLLAAGANPNLKNVRGFKALQHASMNGHTDIVRILEPVTES